MTPLSKEEIEALKQLDLKTFVGFPLLHIKEISIILQNVMPKLIEIAEDHAILKNTKTITFGSSKLKEITNVLNSEQNQIQILKAWLDRFQKTANKRNELLGAIVFNEEETILVPTSSVSCVTIMPWYKRFFRKPKWF